MISAPTLISAREQAQINYDQCLRYFDEMKSKLKRVRKQGKKENLRFKIAIYENYVHQARNNLRDISKISA